MGAFRAPKPMSFQLDGAAGDPSKRAAAEKTASGHDWSKAETAQAALSQMAGTQPPPAPSSENGKAPPAAFRSPMVLHGAGRRVTTPAEAAQEAAAQAARSVATAAANAAAAEVLAQEEQQLKWVAPPPEKHRHRSRSRGRRRRRRRRPSSSISRSSPDSARRRAAELEAPLCPLLLDGACRDQRCPRRHTASTEAELEAWLGVFGGRIPCRWGVLCQAKVCFRYHPPRVGARTLGTQAALAADGGGGG